MRLFFHRAIICQFPDITSPMFILERGGNAQMEDALRRAVERAIQHMNENLSEPLTIDDLADVAMFSKFHFSRIFRNITGIPPGRFLSAVRLQEAKRLLLSTSLTVADISSQVGYSSIGTFSTRFKSS